MCYIIWLPYELTVYIHCRHKVNTYVHEDQYWNRSIAISFDQQKRHYNTDLNIADNLSPGSYNEKELAVKDYNMDDFERCSDEEEMYPETPMVAAETTSVPIEMVDNWEHDQDNVCHSIGDICCSHRLLDVTIDDVVFPFDSTSDQLVYIL